MTQTLYPYPRLPDPVYRIVVDGKEVNGTAREIDLKETRKNQLQAHEVEVEVELPDIGSLDFRVTDLIAVAVLSGGKTDMRQSRVLEPSPLDAHRSAAIMEIDPRNFRGEAELRVIVSGTVGSLEHRILAESDPWEVVLDEEQNSIVRGSLPITWVDFETYPGLQDFVNEPFHVEMTGPVPRVLLNSNSRMSELRQALPRDGRPAGPLVAAYDTIRTGIARAVWLTLVEAAIDGIVVEEGSEPQLPNVQWQAEVLKAVLPRAFGGSLEEAVRTVGKSRDEADEARELEARIRLVIEKDLVRGGTAIRRAVQALGNLPTEEE